MESKMKQAYLGLGTNIGSCLENLQRAVDAVNHLPNTSVVKVSSVYETEPWGYKEQQNFYNICIRIDTEMSPYVLLGGCLGIEADMGRERPFKNSPRVIDIDVLLYEDFESSDKELTIPHKELYNRAFVLYPLEEVLDNKRYRIDIDSKKKYVKNQGILKTENTISCG